MILFVGDIHHSIAEFERIVRAHPSAVVVVQVGDLVPLRSPPASVNAAWRRMPVKVHFIDGNHHDYSVTERLTEPSEVLPGLIYHPRGSVTEIDGRLLAFLGGAESTVDLEWRQTNRDYWPDQEAVRQEDVARLCSNAAGRSIDILVTHSLPASLVQRYAGRPPGPSAQLVEQAWVELGRPELICGHLHDYVRTDRVEVLPYLGATLR